MHDLDEMASRLHAPHHLKLVGDRAERIKWLYDEAEAMLAEGERRRGEKESATAQPLRLENQAFEAMAELRRELNRAQKEKEAACLREDRALGRMAEMEEQLGEAIDTQRRLESDLVKALGREGDLRRELDESKTLENRLHHRVIDAGMELNKSKKRERALRIDFNEELNRNAALVNQLAECEKREQRYLGENGSKAPRGGEVVTPGQIAFKAFWEHLPPAERPKWADAYQERWEPAAQAVKAEVLRWKPMSEAPRDRAIEIQYDYAAKRAVVRWSGTIWEIENSLEDHRYISNERAIGWREIE